MPSLAELNGDDHHWSKPRSHIPEDIIHHLENLSSQLESALKHSWSIQAQQDSPQNTIQLLESKVTAQSLLLPWMLAHSSSSFNTFNPTITSCIICWTNYLFSNLRLVKGHKPICTVDQQLVQDVVETFPQELSGIFVQWLSCWVGVDGKISGKSECVESF